MTHTRPSARTFFAVLITLMSFSVIAAPVVLGGKDAPTAPIVANPVTVCSVGQLPTMWTDNFPPPTTIRVLRTKGPKTGHVETANFWDYVAVVMRAEYSTGATKPPVWMRI